MNSLAWIRLFAYSERAVFQHQRERDQADAREVRVRRGRIMAELRLAIARAIESRPDDRAARTTLTLSNDGSEHGFFVVGGERPSPSAVRVTLSGHGVECTYALGNGGAGQPTSPDVRVVFGVSHLLPATVVGQRETRTFESVKGLTAHLLQPLIADAPTAAAAR